MKTIENLSTNESFGSACRVLCVDFLKKNTRSFLFFKNNMQEVNIAKRIVKDFRKESDEGLLRHLCLIIAEFQTNNVRSSKFIDDLIALKDQEQKRLEDKRKAQDDKRLQEPIVDYYAALSVSRTATIEEIARAYRKEIQKWHPDKHPDSIDEQMSKILNEGYNTLKDPEQRCIYDEELLVRPIRPISLESSRVQCKP